MQDITTDFLAPLIFGVILVCGLCYNIYRYYHADADAFARLTFWQRWTIPVEEEADELLTIEREHESEGGDGDADAIDYPAL